MSEQGGPQGSSDTNPDVHKQVLSDMFDRYRRMGRGVPRKKRVGGSPRGRKHRDAREEFEVEESAPETSDLAEERNAEGWSALDGEFGNGSGDWRPPPGIHRSRSGTGPSGNDPRGIGTILNVERNRRGWNRSISVGTIIGQWDLIVGNVVAQHCPVESFEEGRLVVQADSTAWAQQLRLLLPQVQKRIDEEVGQGVVEQVIVMAPKAPSWKKGPRSVPGRGPRDTYG